MLSIEQIAARVDSLRFRHSERDARNQDVLAVRKGQIASVYPDFFPDGVDANVVANFIDVVARDLSEVMAPLPSVNCSAANQANDRARKFADTRTRIATNYFANSDLQVQMYTGADLYITFGFVPFIIELDEEAGLPRIRIENPVGAYPEFDRYGRCIAFAKRYFLPLGELVASFPEYEALLLGKEGAIELQDRIKTSNIKAAEQQTGMESVLGAQSLARQGVTRSEAARGLAQTKSQLSGYKAEAAAQGQDATTIQKELEGENLLGMASQRRRKLQQGAVARFSGTSGTTQGSLTRSNSGSI